MIGSISYAVADAESSPSYVYQVGNQHGGISEQTAVTIAQQHIKGRVLAINRVKNSYRIKILSNRGTVHIVSVNTADGAIMSSH